MILDSMAWFTKKNSMASERSGALFLATRPKTIRVTHAIMAGIVVQGVSRDEDKTTSCSRESLGAKGKKS
jgi:hypothetical protein